MDLKAITTRQINSLRTHSLKLEDQRIKHMRFAFVAAIALFKRILMVLIATSSKLCKPWV
jgi:hypothetical protein